MITLNLLPYSKRKEIEIKKGSRLVLFLFVAVSFFFFLTVALILVHFSLAKQINNLKFKAVSGEIKNQLASLNKKVSVLEQIQDKFFLYSDSLVDFAVLVPYGVTIEEMTISKTDGVINVKGTASARDDLIQFKKNLDESERFSEVKSPIENILSEEHINFQITAKINLSKLQQL